ncbi:MAG: energy-coupling factor transporter transmembrane protein EcfT [Dehalococcoidia bacterium]|nr:energy-coupling factor transporter transmembrane protein EcfT [Dehalococcoidia bacterium]
MISYKYADKRTVIHKLNPWCKLAWIASVFILALLFNNPLYLLLLFLSTLPLLLAARVWKEWASLMKFFLFLCLLIIVINALASNQGSHVLYQIPFAIPVVGAPKITLEAVLCGAGNSLRLLTIISAFTILTFAIHPDDLMLVLMKAKLPYKSVLVTSLSTRFVPALIGDAQCIADVQRSRGLELDKGSRIQRAKNHMAIAIPLLSNSLDRAVQVAEAMESRAFGSGKNRTFYKELKTTQFDITVLAFALLPLAVGIGMRCLGHGGYEYYPILPGISFTQLEAIMLGSLVLLLNMVFILAPLKRRVDLD